MAAPFARSPSRSTRGTTVEIFAAAESHRHRNRGRAIAPSTDLIEPEDPNREPQSRIQIVAVETKKSFSSFVAVDALVQASCKHGGCVNLWWLESLVRVQVAS
ncbi:hypothetical protein DEO72_LG6g616 [Vigna unguiculata]|uniref:Uncharacterized protein n=1 Tax=Vigna unguiculata TaxID=3917 RepID=A0A4D6M5Q7_VIGUN|nr:hypothetical protein DEO72_LG6g616 [Vigna unguiculata]